MTQHLSIWTIYNNPNDSPGKYVARRYEIDQATPDHFEDNDISTVRAWIYTEALKFGQGEPFCLPRLHNDDPVIVESWV